MRNTLLIDIGAGPLPVVTPVPGQQSAWFPVLHSAPPLPTPPNVRTTPVADGILVEWDAVPIDGVTYVVWRAPAEAGPYAIVYRTTGLRYLHTDNTGEPSWFRVSIELHGRESVPSVPVINTPVDVSAGIAGAEQSAAAALVAALAADARAAQEIIDRQLADSQVQIAAAQDAATKVQAEAQARADALLGERIAWEAAVNTETIQRQSADDSLAQSLSLVSAGSGEQFDSAKIWTFDTTVDGWSGNGMPTVEDGWLRPANHATDPYVQSPAVLALAGESYRFAKLRIKRVGVPAWRGELRWRLAGDAAGVWRGPASIPLPDFDAHGVTTISWQDVAWWPGTVDQVRIDLSTSQTASDYYLIDWVALGRPTPGAGVALVQAVEQASVDRDGANALAREQLAAQLRGTYTGTDVAAVTQGLVWSERQARVSGDDAQAQVSAGITARLPAGAGKVASEASVTDLATSTAAATSAVSQRVGVVEARMPAGVDKLANEALVTAIESASVSRDNALGSRASAIEVRMPAGSDKLANEARVVSAEQAASTATGAVAGRVGAVEARMPAGTGSVASSARVDQVDQARIDGDAANSISITSVSSRVGATENPGINLIQNPTAAQNNAGWTVQTAGFFPVADSSGTYWIATGNAGQISGAVLPSQAGVQYALAADMFAAGVSSGAFQLVAAFYNASFQWLDQILISAVNGQVWKRYSDVKTSPSGTAYVQVYFTLSGATNTTAAIKKIKLETGAAATPYTDDATISSTASVTQSLTARAGPGGAYAQATTMLDVNGRIIGVRQTNDGTTGATVFVTDTFSVVPPDGSTDGIYWQNGLLIVRSGAFQTITGGGFGVGGEFMEWYGPSNVPANACSRANALTYKTTTGGAYFGGVLNAGKLFVSLKSTVVGVAAKLATGTMSNNGQVLTIVVSFSFQKTDSSALGGKWTAGAGTNQVRVNLWAIDSGGGRTLVSTSLMGGSIAIQNEIDGPSNCVWTLGGSFTVVDSNVGVTTRSFVVDLGAEYELQTASLSGGGGVAQSYASQDLTLNIQGP